jgi:hypothetical protein
MLNTWNVRNIYCKVGVYAQLSKPKHYRITGKSDVVPFGEKDNIAYCTKIVWLRCNASVSSMTIYIVYAPKQFTNIVPVST